MIMRTCMKFDEIFDMVSNFFLRKERTLNKPSGDPRFSSYYNHLDRVCCICIAIKKLSINNGSLKNVYVLLMLMWVLDNLMTLIDESTVPLKLLEKVT